MDNDGPNYLRAWREHRHLTQEKLADKVGTTKSVISNLELGERGLSGKWLRRLAPALETQPGLLLDYHPDTVPAALKVIESIHPDDLPNALRALEGFRRLR